MLSIYTLKSASEASKYYQNGDYYTQSTDTQSVWMGKTAEILGLQGKVDIDTFKNLLKGRLPAGEEMIQAKNGGHHRPGYDLTFSAPKSVSILALVAGSSDVLQAHKEAVTEVITKIEGSYASCRVKKNGNVTIEKTGNFLVAGFLHHDSRAGDPNLHTHCVLMNITRRTDGAWRTLFADELYTDKLMNGMEYRSLLAQKLMALGYELTLGKNGTFEISGIPETVLNTFSKRRLQIEQWLEDKNLEGGELAKVANYQTRAAKVNTNAELQKGRWEQELTLSGASLHELTQLSEKAKERGPIALPDPYLLAGQSVTAAIEHLSAYKTLFTLKEVMKSAKQLSLLASSHGDFLKVIEEKIQNKSLLYMEGKYLTTPQIRQADVKNVESMISRKGSVNAMLSGWIARIVSKSLNTETERDALNFLLTTKDQQSLLSSDSRSSLTEVLKTFNAVCQDQGYFPRIVTLRHRSIETLMHRTGIERVSTIEGFLLSCEMRAEKQKTEHPLVGRLQDWSRRIERQQARNVWIIDGEVSTQQINRLQQWSGQFGARILFTQINYYANPALSSLKAKGLAQFNMLEKTPHQALAPKAELLEQIQRLENKNAIQSSPEPKDRLKIAVEQFESNTLLVTQTAHHMRELNTEIREKLKQNTLLSGESHVVDNLQAISLSRTEKKHLQCYNLNDVIRFNRDKPGTLITKDSYFFVKNIDLNKRLIELQTQSGDQVFWVPAKETLNAHHFEIFRSEKRELLLNDRIVWTRSLKHHTDKSLDRIKDQMATVVAIHKGSVSVTLKNGKRTTLDLQELSQQHWEHGYAVLLKNAEISASDKITLCLQSNKIDEKTLQDLQGLFSQTTESSKALQLICDNIETLKKTIEVGGIGNVPSENKPEIPYVRREALSQSQTTVTQQIFHGLQAEYLQARKLNPEFLEKNNLKVPDTATHYSPEFRQACDVVDYLAVYHSERKSVFSLKTLKKEAYELAGIMVPTKVIDGALEMAISKGWLVKVPNLEPSQNPDEIWVCARHTLIMEKLCIQKMKEGQGKLTPIAAKDVPLLKDLQMRPRLTTGQKEAVSLILSSSDQIIAIQGIAGAGKTTALRELNQRCQECDFKSLVLANTGSARNQAQTASGMDSLTVAQFLTRVESLVTSDLNKAKADYGGNRVIILDESSLVSTKDMFRLITVVEQLGARLSVIGDFKQIGSIGAGEISQALLAYGVAVAAMIENVRLKNITAFEAMKQAYAGDMAKTIHTLRDSIEEIPIKSEALERIVTLYTGMKQEFREQTLIITPLNEDRNFVNQAIREKLQNTKELEGEPLITRIFLPQDRHEIEKANIFSYDKNDHIRFNTQHSRLGIQAGDYLKVQEIDLKHQRLTLMFENGDQIYWMPKDLQRSSDIEIYRQEERTLMKNDVIIFKRNHNSYPIFNGDKAKILAVEGTSSTIALLNGNIVTLDLGQNENKHLDYGYALTAYAGQGRDVTYVLAYGDGPKPLSKKTSDLKVGDTIVLPKPQLSKEVLSGNETSKLVSVTAITKNELTLKDKNNQIYNIKAEKNQVWDYFPPFESRKDQELPLSTTQKSFLVQITRGDNLCLIVPHVQDFQKTLEKHKGNEGSALRHLDPNWKDLNHAVERLVENISGKAERQTVQIEDSAQKMKTERSVLEPAILNQGKERLSTKRTCLKTNEYRQVKIDIHELERRLATDLLGNASRWLGSPNRVTSREARWGNKGSFCLTLSGSKAGVWSNFEVGKGGKGLVSLYKEIHGIEWKEAIQELGREYGLQPPPKSTDFRLNPFSTKDLKSKEENYQKQKIKYAQKEYKKAVPIQGTLAEKYLREVRGITGKLPEDFRFRANGIHLNTQKPTPALIAPYRDKNNTLIGFVRVFLNSDGGKYQESFIDKSGNTLLATRKANVGLSAHGSVVVQKGVFPNALYIAEGIETALSISTANPNHTVVASLSASQLKNVPINPAVEKVIICADNDPASANTKKSVIEAVERHLSEGRKVFIAIPPEISVGMKADFNDLLKQGGTPAVRQALKQMIEIKNAAVLRTEEPRLSVILQRLQAEQKAVCAKTPEPISQSMSRTSNQDIER